MATGLYPYIGINYTYEGYPVAKRPGFFMCELYNINRRKVCDGIFNDGIGNSFYCKKND